MARRELGPAALRVVQAVRSAVEEGDLVQVACSGGPDSLALTAAAIHCGIAERVVIVDHALQAGSGEVAARVAEQVRQFAERVVSRGEDVPGDPALRQAPGSGGVELADAPRTVSAKSSETTGSPDPRQARRPGAEDAEVTAGGARPAIEVRRVSVQETGDGPEAAARRARYQVFEDSLHAHGGVMLLGHTLDDQAETVLLGLARGSGGRSLSGMSAAAGGFVRPLLGLRREDTEQACRQWGLRPWRDPHNEDPQFTRVRVRRRVLPVLEAELGPGVSEALGRTAEMLRADADLLDELTDRALPAELASVDELSVAALPEVAGLRQRVLRRWVLTHGATQPSRAHILALDRLITDWHGQKWVELPGLRVGRGENRLRILRD